MTGQQGQRGGCASSAEGASAPRASTGGKPAEQAHSGWCACERCEAEDREQELAALAGIGEDPAVEAEFGVPAPDARSPTLDPYDLRCDEAMRRAERGTSANPYNPLYEGPW